MPEIGRLFSEIKDVLPGVNEYTSLVEINEELSASTGNLVLGRNDGLEIIFDDDLVVDDITVNNVRSESDFIVNLIYPNGGKLALQDSPTTQFTLNRSDSTSSSKWYRLPRWSRLRLSLTPNTQNGVLRISVVARS